MVEREHNLCKILLSVLPFFSVQSELLLILLSLSLSLMDSLVVQTVKNLPAMWETQVRSLG